MYICVKLQVVWHMDMYARFVVQRSAAMNGFDAMAQHSAR